MKVIWLTGLSGSGKTTLANALVAELKDQKVYVLDGDELRLGLNNDLGYSNEDRIENIRRAAEVAKLLMDLGFIVIAAFISPSNKSRKLARQIIGSINYIEVFVDTPLEVCERRDPKGLYKKARNGFITNMTGVDSVFETPSSPDVIYTERSSLQEIINLLN